MSVCSECGGELALPHLLLCMAHWVEAGGYREPTYFDLEAPMRRVVLAVDCRGGGASVWSRRFQYWDDMFAAVNAEMIARLECAEKAYTGDDDAGVAA